MVQPLAGKLILPYLGGASAVWTACMLFFQSTLLIGYLYSSLSIKFLGCQKQSVIHFLLLSLGFIALPLSIDFNGFENVLEQPVVWLIFKLAGTIGFLFFIVSANAPMIQRWYSETNQKDSSDPYFLYAASNGGSLLALIGYPLVIEPLIKVSHQRYLWSGGYILLSVLVISCAAVLWRGKAGIKNDFSEKADVSCPDDPEWNDVFKWILWAFIPSSVMLGVTTHISTDIASMPLIWVFPLAIFLATFIFVFAKTDYWRKKEWEILLVPMAVVCAVIYYFEFTQRAWFAALFHLAFLFVICMTFHSKLANTRPAPRWLNSFFVWMSVGGIAGGLFNSVFAPAFFSTQIEYVIVVVLAVAVIAFEKKNKLQNREIFRRIFIGCVIFFFMLGAFAIFRERYFKALIRIEGIISCIAGFFIINCFFKFRKLTAVFFILANLIAFEFITINRSLLKIDRSFFGVLKVTRSLVPADSRLLGANVTPDSELILKLNHGTTLHGVERKLKIRPVFPLAYYSKEGPAGNIFRATRINRRAKKVGVVGLGCGTLAYYGRPWQEFDFFEIDPKVIDIAEDSRFFTYLENCKAKYRIIAGDARINLRRIPDNKYDLLVMDAYSSDAIPIHLITKEAFELYTQKLASNGIIAFHVSNRLFNLRPVIKRICDELGLKCLAKYDEPKNYSLKYDWYDFNSIAASLWVVVARSKEDFKLLDVYKGWEPLKKYKDFQVWTDDYSNVLQTYNWR